MIYYIEDLLDKKEEGRALEMDESLNRQSRGKVWFGALGILLSVAVGGALCSRGLYLLSLFDALSVSAQFSASVTVVSLLWRGVAFAGTRRRMAFGNIDPVSVRLFSPMYSAFTGIWRIWASGIC